MALPRHQCHAEREQQHAHAGRGRVGGGGGGKAAARHEEGEQAGVEQRGDRRRRRLHAHHAVRLQPRLQRPHGSPRPHGWDEHGGVRTRGGGEVGVLPDGDEQRREAEQEERKRHGGQRMDEQCTVQPEPRLPRVLGADRLAHQRHRG